MSGCTPRTCTVTAYTRTTNVFGCCCCVRSDPAAGGVSRVRPAITCAVMSLMLSQHANCSWRAHFLVVVYCVMSRVASAWNSNPGTRVALPTPRPQLPERAQARRLDFGERLPAGLDVVTAQTRARWSEGGSKLGSRTSRSAAFHDGQSTSGQERERVPAAAGPPRQSTPPPRSGRLR